MSPFNALLCLAAAAGTAGGRPLKPDMSREPKVGDMKPYRAPRRRRFKLSNGLQVVFVEDRRQPLLSVRLAVEGGRSMVSLETPGLASAMGGA